jgi:hypothetical protein
MERAEKATIRRLRGWPIRDAQHALTDHLAAERPDAKSAA